MKEEREQQRLVAEALEEEQKQLWEKGKERQRRKEQEKLKILLFTHWPQEMLREPGEETARERLSKPLWKEACDKLWQEVEECKKRWKQEWEAGKQQREEDRAREKENAAKKHEEKWKRREAWRSQQAQERAREADLWRSRALLWQRGEADETRSSHKETYEARRSCRSSRQEMWDQVQELQKLLATGQQAVTTLCFFATLLWLRKTEAEESNCSEEESDKESCCWDLVSSSSEEEGRWGSEEETSCSEEENSCSEVEEACLKADIATSVMIRLVGGGKVEVISTDEEEPAAPRKRVKKEITDSAEERQKCQASPKKKRR